MDQKTKIKVAIVSALVVLAIIFILMVLFVRGNRDKKIKESIPTKTSNETIPTENDVEGNSTDPSNNTNTDENFQAEIMDIEDIRCIAMKDGNIVELDKNENYAILKKIKNQTVLSYTYDNESLYIAYESAGTTIGKIDLNSGEEEIIFETDEYKYGDGLEVYNDKIYFVTVDYKLIEHSIPEDFTRIIVGGNTENETTVSSMGTGRSFVIDKTNNILYMSALLFNNNVLEAGVYKLDFTSNSITKIIEISSVPGDLILNKDTLILDVVSASANYAFNRKTETIEEVGIDKDTKKIHSAIGKFAFFDETIFYTDEINVKIRDAMGNPVKDDLYVAEEVGYIYSIVMMPKGKLEVVLAGNDNIPYKSLLVDIDSGNVTESDTIFTDVLNIK